MTDFHIRIEKIIPVIKILLYSEMNDYSNQFQKISKALKHND